MAWPEDPKTFAELPLEPVSLKVFNSNSSLDSRTEGVVCEFVSFVHDDLEAITDGDEEKEQKLAMLLSSMAFRAASAATPEDIKLARRQEWGLDF